MRTTFFLLIFTFSYLQSSSQNASAPYGSGLKVEMSDDGKKYFRLITWHQFWLQVDPAASSFSINPTLRRSRVLIQAQLDENFLILTHFGLNNLTPLKMDATGQSSEAQIFMHDAWGEWKINNRLFIGSGLHYWNGISRLNNQSTLNFLPLDNPRQAWTTQGLSDQFSRHLGVYAKGKVGKLDYRVSWNSPIQQSNDVNAAFNPSSTQTAYTGRRDLGSAASNAYAGYFNYQFFDQENNKFPFFVGSYFGEKDIFNLGAGFFSHPNGTVYLDAAGQTVGHNVFIWAVDAFLEKQLFKSGYGITAYSKYQRNDFGLNYQMVGNSEIIFSGATFYNQIGVVLPRDIHDVRVQPYVTFAANSIDAAGSANTVGLGANFLLNGHNSKITLEYKSTGRTDGTRGNMLTTQAVIFL